MLTIRRVDDGNPVVSGMFKEMLDADMKPTDWCWLAMAGDLVVGSYTQPGVAKLSS